MGIADLCLFRRKNHVAEQSNRRTQSRSVAIYFRYNWLLAIEQRKDDLFRFARCFLKHCRIIDHPLHPVDIPASRECSPDSGEDDQIYCGVVVKIGEYSGKI